jgi:hypothetical protein
MKFRIGITGSDQYPTKIKIKNIIFNLKKQFGDELVIYSRGSLKGVDLYVKKFSIEFGIDYAEFTPSYHSKTLYSVNKNEYYYNKPYSGRDIYKRSLQMIKQCHAFILFKYEDDKVIDYMITQITKSNKKFKLIEKHEAIRVR